MEKTHGAPLAGKGRKTLWAPASRTSGRSRQTRSGVAPQGNNCGVSGAINSTARPQKPHGWGCKAVSGFTSDKRGETCGLRASGIHPLS